MLPRQGRGIGSNLWWMRLADCRATPISAGTARSRYCSSRRCRGIGAATSGTSGFSIAYGDLGMIVTGQVRYTADTSGLGMEWQPQSPAWARDCPFRSSADRAGADGIVAPTSPRAAEAAAKPTP